MRTRFLFALLLLFFAAPAAFAQEKPAFFSAHELAEMCTSKYDTDYGYCAGYVSAIANQLKSESVAGYRACNHDLVRSQQYVDIFRSYAGNFPETLGAEAGIAVAAAMSRAFPCR